ncbi:hypothetical protein J7E25_00355 [Agromyces sp. ISL-38]|uniref:TRAP transporter substrate-binding protein n=1 Tax=Agromyces sp. ISL-38 TaxID=2819107 RepID=UPI001BE683FA|nr:hypothetical protein [Agromyces sp. ISL-38]MBT2497542.1 hypothetical protein [Agromyces sp. ISL-38]
MSKTARGSAVLAVAMLLAGCAAGADKAGSETLVLRLATIDGGLDPTGIQHGQAAFVEALSEVSDGRIEVEIAWEYGEGRADAESDLVRAIADGDLDGGWPSTRAFAAAGFTGMKAIEAPLTLTNYEALGAVIDGPAGEQLLATLDSTPIIGLGTTISELRRPFSTEPLAEPSDWEGVRFRSYNSPVQSEAITALGGEPVSAGLDWRERVEAGELDGAELGLGIGSLVGGDALPNVTANVVLWPKLVVLSLNRERFESLSDEQRGWIEQAARIGVGAAVAGDYDESEFAEVACSAGVRFVAASDDAIAALRERVQPVIDAIAADPAERALLDEVRKVAQQHPAPYIPVIPAGCGEGGSGALSDDDVAFALIPDGIYRTDVTLDDLNAAGVSNSNGYTGTWTITVDAGTYAYTCQPNALPGTDCGHSTYASEAEYANVLEAGYLRGDERIVRFVYDAAVHDRLAGCGSCHSHPTKTVGWQLQGETLTFTDVGEPVIDELLVIEPWAKVG